MKQYRPLSILAFLAMSFPAHAQSFSGAFEGMSDSKEPVQIEADRLEVQDNQGIAMFEGNVAVNQGSTLLKTSKLKVYYIRDAQSEGEANSLGSNIKKIEASGKVAVRSGDQVATADNAVVDMQGQTATLSGNVTVSQGVNIITGCNLKINLATNAANLTPCSSGSGKQGRPTLVFTPSTSKQ